MPYVIYEKRDHVAIITLNRPERMNALGNELSAELRQAEAEFAADDDAWIGIYTGAGDRAFCAGRDLKEAAEQEARPAASGGTPRVPPPITRFERIAPDHGKPTIAAINGAAYGGGLEKALTCDIRICSDNAHMALAEVKVGLCPPGGSFNLP
ncbi:MAG: enoyl-CoA hydratase-related protein, partial [Gammaproteobacteria bacterium]|nr:enoyl-CoA hydratase-related protein [Gammaproteobacteria bacterium]